MHEFLHYLLVSTFICVVALLLIAGGAWAIVCIVSEVISRYQYIRQLIKR